MDLEKFKRLLNLQRHFATVKVGPIPCGSFENCYDPHPTVQALLRADLATTAARLAFIKSENTYARRAGEV